MFTRKYGVYPQTCGELGLVLAYGGIAAMCGGVAFLAAQQFSDDQALLVLLWAAFVGVGSASGAFYLMRHWIGQAGLRGLHRALWGSAIVWAIAVCLFVVLMLPVMGGDALGQLATALPHILTAELVLMWGLAMGCVHGLMAIANGQNAPAHFSALAAS